MPFEFAPQDSSMIVQLQATLASPLTMTTEESLYPGLQVSGPEVASTLH